MRDNFDIIKEIISMCGFEGKECAICWFGGRGCLAAMLDDDFIPASKEDIIERLKTNQFNQDRQLMIDTLLKKYNYKYEENK